MSYWFNYYINLIRKISLLFVEFVCLFFVLSLYYVLYISCFIFCFYVQQGKQRTSKLLKHFILSSQTQRRTRNLLTRFRSPMSAKFWRHSVLSGGTKRHALPRYQSEEMKRLNVSFPQVDIEFTICRTFLLLRHDWP